MDESRSVSFGVSTRVFAEYRRSDSFPEALPRLLEALRTNERLQEPSVKLRAIPDDVLATIVLGTEIGMPFCTKEKAEKFAEDLGDRAGAFVREIAHDLPFELTPDPKRGIAGYIASCSVEAARRAVVGMDVTVVQLDFRPSSLKLAFVNTMGDKIPGDETIPGILAARLSWCCKHADVCPTEQARILDEARGALS